MEIMQGKASVVWGADCSVHVAFQELVYAHLEANGGGFCVDVS